MEAARRLEDDGWVLDAGQAHRGQGTRNRRLAWPDQFFELLWVTDAAEARANPLRLDRRADWTTTGASPFGLVFRGPVDPVDGDDFWLYDLLGPRIWIHRDNERCPERPLVLVLETAEEEVEQRRPRVGMSGSVAHHRPGELREVRVRGPSAPSLPPFAGPPDGVGRRRRRLPPASQRRLGDARLKARRSAFRFPCQARPPVRCQGLGPVGGGARHPHRCGS
jgi:hypothetical protein